MCDNISRVIHSPDDVELGTYRGPVRNNDIVQLIHDGIT